MLVGCASEAGINREAAVTLEPMPRPVSLPTELKWTGSDPAVEQLISTANGMATWKQVEGSEAGCTWTNDGWFAPASQWSDCDGSGSATAKKEGDIWPLEVGKTESYEVKGQDGSDSWQTTRTCIVKAAVLVTVGERELPAYEVACEDKWRVRTWYISPELQRAVRYKNWHKQRGLQSDVTLAL
jgi:hypothetical protein